MWGASQDILRKIEIPIVSGKNCRNEYGIFRKDTLLCAGAEEGKLYTKYQLFLVKIVGMNIILCLFNAN